MEDAATATMSFICRTNQLTISSTVCAFSRRRSAIRWWTPAKSTKVRKRCVPTTTHSILIYFMCKSIYIDIIRRQDDEDGEIKLKNELNLEYQPREWEWNKTEWTIEYFSIYNLSRSRTTIFNTAVVNFWLHRFRMIYELRKECGHIWSINCTPVDEGQSQPTAIQLQSNCGSFKREKTDIWSVT